MRSPCTGESVRQQNYLRTLGSWYYGIGPGQTLTKVGNTNVTTLTGLLSAIRKTPIGSTQRITLTQTRKVAGKSTSQTITSVVMVGC
jgi:hypothetical protein